MPSPKWVLPGHRVTRRLAGFVQRLLRGALSVTEVERISGVDWKLIKELDKAQLEHQYENIDMSKVQRLAIDEISIEKGHSYATVVLDLEDKKILWVGKGKRKVDVQPFFDLLKEQNIAQNIRSVSVDMNAAFPSLVKKNLPNALLAYDLFHVMQLVTRNVLVAAKRAEIQRARLLVSQTPKRQRTEELYLQRDQSIRLLKSSEWLVVRYPELLSDGHRSKLEQLRQCNALFRDIYPLAAQLRAIWQATDLYDARELLAHTIELCREIAKEHDFKPLNSFADMLTNRADGIVNSCLVRLGTNILEGCNNTAKVLKRLAYGYRDHEYFALKLKAAFPGRSHKAIYDTWSLLWQGERTYMGLPSTFTK